MNADSRAPGRLHVLAQILRKDLILYSRDWLFLAVTVISLTFFAVLYHVLPADVEPEFRLGVRGRELQPVVAELAGTDEEGLPLAFFDDSAELREAVAGGEIDVGIDFPDGILDSMRSGEFSAVTVYATATLPPEYRGAVTTMVREISFALAGFDLPVTEPSDDDVILGPAIGPVPIRDKMRPLYAFMVLVMEAVALGTLISSEVQQRTMTALLVTSARVSDVLLSKSVLGTLIAFSEAVIVMVLIRGFGPAPGLVLVALLLGATLVTGVAMIAGSAGKDLVGTMLVAMFMLIPLIIPALAVLFPGTTAWWVSALPSYGLVRAILDTTVLGHGWSESLPELVFRTIV